MGAENKLVERILGNGSPPSIEELFAEGYTVICLCGLKIRTYEEFLAHDRDLIPYYRNILRLTKGEKL